MSEQIKQIAQRIKDLKDISTITAEEIAKKLNISLESYLEYERGEKDFPISILFELASIYGVETTDIILGDSPKLNTYCLVKKDKGVHIDRTKDYIYQNLAYKFHNKKFEPYLVTVDTKVGDTLPPPNIHPGHEFNYVIEGDLKITIGEKELILEKGDSLYFDPTIPHNMESLNDKPAKFIAIVTN